MTIGRRSFSVGLGAWAVASTAAFSAGAIQEPPAGQRLTAAVSLNGLGPFVFAIDTAANASVVAAEVAEALQLPSAGRLGMHTLIGREEVGSVRAETLSAGALSTRTVRLATAPRAGLGGVDGLLGLDLLSDLRLDLRFRGMQRLRIARSRAMPGSFFDGRRPSAQLVQAASRGFGRMTMIEAQAGRVPALAILDTGAQVSVANTAFASASGASYVALRDGGTQGRVKSPTGRTAPAALMSIPSLHFAGVSFRRTPVMVGDFHTFDIWGVGDRPALLLGVDLLGLFETVSIDLKRGEVVFST